MMTMGARPEADTEARWAVMLAGGDGTRLRSVTRRIAGDERPKQFCRLLGETTMLDQARARAAVLVEGASVALGPTCRPRRQCC
jgi:mannose-1-phosphate guanylyltransferase